MASLKDKITAFQMIMNDDGLTEKILKQAANAEKSADDAGLEFKETNESDGDETVETKAKGKMPAAFLKNQKKKKPVDDEAESDEEDMTEDEDAEEEEESKEGDDSDDSDAGDDAVDDAAEFDEDLDEEDEDEEDEDEEEGKEFTDFVGDLPVDAFAEMIATTWKEAFRPVAALLQLSIEAMKEMTTASKEVRDPAAMKEITDRLAGLEKTVKAMVGDMPKATKKALRGYRATEDEDTVVEGGEEAMKEVGPGKADPGFLNFMGLK